jgi:transketolase
MHIFKKEFPNRFVEIGIAEQNLASVASGMAAMGKITFISSYAMFSPGRNWEQIRTTVCYNNSNVKIAGSHAGVSVGPDGATHQAVEDMAITRVLPNMMVISPCDMLEAKKATLALAQVPSPAYLRLAREPTPVMTTAETPFQIGKAHVFWDAENPKVTIIATGALVHKALVAAKELEKEKVEVVVVNLSTIKPLDTETILREAKRTGRVVTVEEHQIAGGMGSAVAEYLSQVFPVPIEYIGVHNEFGQSGTPEELIEHYGMGVSHIKEAVQKVLSR